MSRPIEGMWDVTGLKEGIYKHPHEGCNAPRQVMIMARTGKSGMTLQYIMDALREAELQVSGDLVGKVEVLDMEMASPHVVVLDSEDAMREGIVTMDYSSIEDRIYAGLAKQIDKELFQTLYAPKSKKELEKERKKQREDFHKFVNSRRRGKRK